MKMKIVSNPKAGWLEAVAKGEQLWLVKEQQAVTVAWPYIRRDGDRCGRIGLTFADSSEQDWVIDADGKGMDESVLAALIEPELPVVRKSKPPQKANGRTKSSRPVT